MRVEYSSNNSGGGWWLRDEDWKALEDAGWEVEWGGRYYCDADRQLRGVDRQASAQCPPGSKCPGHRESETYAEAVGRGKRWLGAMATRATKDFDTLAEAVREFEAVTGQDASDEGCNCCGAPHSFSTDDDWVSGEDVLPILYGSGPSTLRDALEALKDRTP